MFVGAVERWLRMAVHRRRRVRREPAPERGGIDEGVLQHLPVDGASRPPANVVLATRMVSARVRDFESARRTLLTTDRSPETGKFVEGLQHWIAGSLAWHRTSPRYAQQLAVPTATVA